MYKIGLISAFILLALMDVTFAGYEAGVAGHRSIFQGSLKESQSGSCPQGTYAVGILVRGGQYVDRIYLQCKGSEGVKTGGGLSARNPLNMLHYNSREQSVFCRGSRRLTGIKFKAGGYVDRVASIRCQNSSGGDTEFLGVGIGGTGGNDVRAYCRTGDHVTSLVGFAGSWVDVVKVFCD